ncbi:MAG: zeta toxin family protein [Verrucomicrobiota bacterium]
MKAKPKFFLLAGINGAGKSTFYEDRLKPLGLPFINADHIAATLDPKNATHSDEISLQAQKLAEQLRTHHLQEKKSFVSETVFSHHSKVDLIKEAQDAGFVVTLIFINLPSSDLAQHRVIQRSQKGGHDVPPDKISSRYPRVMENIVAAKSIPDHFFVFDNNRRDKPHTFLMHLKKGIVDRVSEYQPTWAIQMFPVEYQTNQIRKILLEKEKEIRFTTRECGSFQKAVKKILPLFDQNLYIPAAFQQIEKEFTMPALRHRSNALSCEEYSSVIKRPESSEIKWTNPSETQKGRGFRR